MILRNSVCFCLVLFQFSCKEKNNELDNVFPELHGLYGNEFKMDRIQMDPNYRKPYNIYISFKLKNQEHKRQIIDRLELIDVDKVNRDSVMRITSLEQFQLYFGLHSLNVKKSARMQGAENSISWWLPKDRGFEKIYIVPFYEYDNKIKVRGNFNPAPSGRIACTFCSGTVYILVESWEF